MSKKGLTTQIIMASIICMSYSTANANKSVFIISKHHSPSKAEAFSIDGDQVDLQATIDIDELNPVQGPCWQRGLA